MDKELDKEIKELNNRIQKQDIKIEQKKLEKTELIKEGNRLRSKMRLMRRTSQKENVMSEEIELIEKLIEELKTQNIERITKIGALELKITEFHTQFRILEEKVKKEECDV